MPKASTHWENRLKICLLCFGKTKVMIRIKGKLKDRLDSVFEYNDSDERLPLVLCNNCKRNLFDENKKENLTKLPNFSTLEPFRKIKTRLSDKVTCFGHICQLARKPGHTNFSTPVSSNIFSKPNIMKDVTNGKNPEKIKYPLVESRCSYCFSLIGRGISHKCNLSSRLDNLTKIVIEAGPKVTEQVVSSLMKRKVDENERNNTPLSLIQSRGGQRLRITVGSEKKKNTFRGSLLSADNSKLIEPHLKEKLVAESHCLNNLFGTKNFDFINLKNNKIVSTSTEVVAHCVDLEGLINYIKQKRQLTKFHLKFGIDGGGEFLKICLSIQSTAEEDELDSFRQKYDQGILAKRFKDSGVNKLFILALAQGCQENYENVAQLWSELKIIDFDGTIATDLKLANIIVGIMSHSSRFPCTWCYAKNTELEECSSFRTVSNTLENYLNWYEAGAAKSKAKEYKNCIHLPLLISKDKTFLQAIPPPELHLMLGVVNTVFSYLLTDWEEDALRWVKACNVQRDITHGSPSFNGNSCRIFLKKLDILRSRSKNLGCLKNIQVFETSRKVVDACFGSSLDPSFEEAIAAFKKSYIELGKPVTPKVHPVFSHVLDFCEDTQSGLGFFSEQSMESVHCDFKTIWMKYKVSRSHSEYSKRLQRAISEYNSLHSF